MKPRKSHLITAAVVVVLAALTALATRPRAVPVDVAAADIGYLQSTVDEEGRTRVRQRYVVTAPVAGRLSRMALDEGDAIRKGQTIVRISPMPLDARAVAQAEARLDAAAARRREAGSEVGLATATLEEANRQLARAESLAVAGLIAEEELDHARVMARTSLRAVEAAQSRADAAAFEVDVARAALVARAPAGPQPGDECLELTAPIDGVVLRVHEENERVVPVGTPLMDLGNPGDLEIVVDVLSTEAVRIESGAPMLLEAWGGDRTIEAVVRLVEPSGFTKVSALGVEEQRVNVVADFITPPSGLGDGFKVETRTVVWASDSALAVPWSALVRRRNDWGVFTVVDERARWRDVTVGHHGAAAAQIIDGVSRGELVIVHPNDDIADGVRVVIGVRMAVDRR